MATGTTSDEAAAAGSSLATIERSIPSASDIADRDVAEALVQVAAIQTRAGALQQALIGRLVKLLAEAAPSGSEGDRFLRIDVAASILGKSKDWIYHNWKSLPFAVRHGGHLAFSQKGMADWMRRRLQAKRTS